MTESDNYKLLDDTGNVIAMGTQSLIFSFVKHHVPDGRYRIVGPDLKLHCLRKDGIVGPAPDGVSLQAKTTVITLGELMVVTDPPYSDGDLDEGDHEDV